MPLVTPIEGPFGPPPVVRVPTTEQINQGMEQVWQAPCDGCGHSLDFCRCQQQKPRRTAAAT